MSTCLNPPSARKRAHGNLERNACSDTSSGGGALWHKCVGCEKTHMMPCSRMHQTFWHPTHTCAV